MITGIVIALPEELGTLTSKKLDKGCCVAISGNIVLAYSGAGATNARAASEALIGQGACRLISWGCAAALSTNLKPGDLILADTLIDADSNPFDTHPEWIEISQTLLPDSIKIHIGSLAESHGIVSSSASKKQLHAGTGAIALDMESVAVAKVAQQNNLPFLTVRAIADPVDMDLPKAIDHSLNREGDVVLGKLLSYIALHPAELPGLIKLGLHFNAAKKTLKLVARHVDRLTAFPSPAL